MNALRALPGRTFSILMSLEPAVAALCGLVLLGEHLTKSQWLAVGLVIAASVGATVTARQVPVQRGGLRRRPVDLTAARSTNEHQ
jgi:inner membrane transporter RhtA